MAWTRTFGQMKTDLGTWLGVDTDASNPNYVRLPEDVREFIILQARRRISLRRDLRFFDETETITTADGDYTNGLPANYQRPYYMWYMDTSTDSEVEVKQITRSVWHTKYSSDDTDNDEPTHYCIYGDQYVWVPTPDAVYTIYHDYYKQPADFTADADYDDFLVDGWDAIFFEALANGCDYVMEMTRLREFQAKARQHLNELVGDHARARYSGRGLQNEIPG